MTSPSDPIREPTFPNPAGWRRHFADHIWRQIVTGKCEHLRLSRSYFSHDGRASSVCLDCKERIYR